jgi:hypothetical protein
MREIAHAALFPLCDNCCYSGLRAAGITRGIAAARSAPLNATVAPVALKVPTQLRGASRRVAVVETHAMHIGSPITFEDYPDG